MTTNHLTLSNQLHEIVKARVAADHPPNNLDDQHGTSDDLFADHDAQRGHGHGVYVCDEEEAASRRIDLTACADPDLGPIPAPEAPDSVDALVLRFAVS